MKGILKIIQSAFIITNAHRFQSLFRLIIKLLIIYALKYKYLSIILLFDLNLPKIKAGCLDCFIE